jgi:transcriptional regulator with XRE-family HTH domain
MGFFVTVGTLINEQSTRLGFTQTELAEYCGVGRRAQIHFEQDDSLPGGAYLQAATALGMDVLYVLTGNRHGISAEEAQVLAAYRVASPEVRIAVKGALGAVTKAAAARKSVVRGDVGQLVQGDAHQSGMTLNVGGKGKKKK